MPNERRYEDLAAHLAESLTALRLGEALTDNQIANRCTMTPDRLSRVLSGRRPPKENELLRLCNLLGLDFVTALSVLLRCKGEDEAADHLAAVGQAAGPAIGSSDSNEMNLSNWRQFGFRTVVMGDRRDTPAATPADVLAHSASIGDLYCLSELARPMGIWFDKPVASKEALASPFDDNLIVLGSPEVNLAAQYVCTKSCFRLNIDERHLDRLKQHREDLRGHDGDATTLEHRLDELGPAWLESVRDSLKSLRGNGFLDPFRQEPTGVNPSKRCRGLVTFAEHPWRKDKFVIFAAGSKGLATGASLRVLADTKFLRGRPLGGVFSVHDQTDWATVDPVWETDPYTIDEYLEQIRGRPEWEGLEALVSRIHAAGRA